MFDDEIFEKHPELLELREFKNNDEIVAALKNGGSNWLVQCLNGKPIDFNGPIEVLRVEPYTTREISRFHGFPICVLAPGQKILLDRLFFVSDLQNSPSKGVFTSEERAEKYLAAAKSAFESDEEWQNEFLEKQEWMNAAYDAISNFTRR